MWLKQDGDLSSHTRADKRMGPTTLSVSFLVLTVASALRLPHVSIMTARVPAIIHKPCIRRQVGIKSTYLLAETVPMKELSWKPPHSSSDDTHDFTSSENQLGTLMADKVRIKGVGENEKMDK